MTWPYLDPNFAATLATLAAATGTLPPPYHPQGFPPTTMAPGYPLAAYYSRYHPYAGSAPTSNAVPLQRPHLQTPSYPHHPHILQPHPNLTPLHLAGLGVPNMSNTAYMSPPISSSINTPTYRPNLISEMSPVHSDTSSDYECNGSIHQHNVCHIPSQDKASPPLKPIALSSLPAQIQTNTYEVKSVEDYGMGLRISPLSKSSKDETPKLFQPYKNDVSEKA